MSALTPPEKTLEEWRQEWPYNGGRGDTYANGRPIDDWPLCDLCGELMDQVDKEIRVATFVCRKDGFSLSFPGCRYSDKYCAWETAVFDKMLPNDGKLG